MVISKFSEVFDPESTPLIRPEPAYETQRYLAVQRAARWLFTVAFVVCFAWILIISVTDSHQNGGLSLDERVNKIMQQVPLLDGHNDFPLLVRQFHHNQVYDNFTFEKNMRGDTDLSRLLKGRVGAQFWSCYVPCPHCGTPSEARSYKAVHDTMQQIDVVKKLCSKYSKYLGLATTSQDVSRLFDQRRIASMLGIEGLHQIGGSPAILRMYYELGVRYVTLTHTCHNEYADSANGIPMHGGLSQNGRTMIAEFNRLGMIVDLSHTSVETMEQTINISKAPAFFSHSSAYAICPHERNVPDKVLHLVKSSNGVVCVNFYNPFVRCGGSKTEDDATIEDVVEHIVHIGEVIGYEHVGIGSDFDGIDKKPAGLDDVSKYPQLLRRLLERGISDENVKKVAGENVVRVWKDTEATAHDLQQQNIRPFEESAEPFSRV